MIGSIQLENYKAFSDVTIPLRPLTILLGANSAGKSSIIQMLMLLHQTAEERGDLYSSALKIYGNYVNAGSYEYLFKNKIIDNPLHIKIDLVSNSLVGRIKEMKTNYLIDCERLGSLFVNRRSMTKKEINNKQDFKFFIDNVIKLVRKEKKSIPTYVNYFLKHAGITEKELRRINHEGIYKVYDFLTKLNDFFKDDTIKVEFELQLINDSFIITGLNVSSSDLICLFEIKSSPNNRVKIESDVLTLDKEEHQLIVSYFRQNQTIFNCIGEVDDIEEVESLVVYLAVNLLREILAELRDNFMGSNINYVSPLRAHPKRYYMLDKANTTISLDTLDGDQIAEVLKDKTAIKSKVNEWFKNFGLEIDVKGVKEVIHHLKVSQYGLTLDITDVGFGISQVLPIIIQGFLSRNNSITIIEQPEIHLHPRIQADLGDLFIDIVKENNKQLVIETHSEYILKRIRRRISEGVISATDVSICLFHAKTEERDAWVELLNIGEKGDFKWPEEYYGGELSEDTFVFLKNQA